MHPCTAQPLILQLDTSTDPICGAGHKAVAAVDTSKPATAVTPTTPDKATPDKASPSGSWPWYAWALVVLGALLIIGGLVYAFFPSKKEAPKKKKRAIKATPAPAAAPVAPVATTSVAMPVYQPMTTAVTTAPPVYLQAPQMTYAAPASVSYAAPQMTYAEPQMTYAAPAASVSYAAPGYNAYTGPVTTVQGGSMSYAAAPGGSATFAPAVYQGGIAAEPVTGGMMPMFDQLDRNHDGSISRAEFAAAMGR